MINCIPTSTWPWITITCGHKKWGFCVSKQEMKMRSRVFDVQCFFFFHQAGWRASDCLTGNGAGSPKPTWRKSRVAARASATSEKTSASNVSRRNWRGKTDYLYRNLSCVRGSSHLLIFSKLMDNCFNFRQMWGLHFCMQEPKRVTFDCPLRGC